MRLGMALASRIVTGEEPCLRKVLYEIKKSLSVGARAIQYKLEHELLVAKTIETLKGEIYVNEWVTRNVSGIQLNGKIDIVNVNNGDTTIFEVKSGIERESHHIQLWLYLLSFEARNVRGRLLYKDKEYMYRETDIPLNLWNIVFQRTRPLLSENLPPVKGSHCHYCKYNDLCQKEVETFCP